MAADAAVHAARSWWNKSFLEAMDVEIARLCAQGVEKAHEKVPSALTQSTEVGKTEGTQDSCAEILQEPKSHQDQDDKAPIQASSHKSKVTADARSNGQEKVPTIMAEEPSLSNKNDKHTLSEIDHLHSVSGSGAIAEIDLVFLKILDRFIAMISNQARSSTEFVLEVSNNFLDDRAKNALDDFHNLYFAAGASHINDTSKRVNDEVDAIFDSLQGIIAEGKELTLDSVQEEESSKVNRLSLSGLQKRLEMIISMDVGIKEKLIPVLHSMQFEDFLNQRLLHIRKMWAQVLSAEMSEGDFGLENIKAKLAKYPSSVEEREDFYRIVLKQEPPDGVKEKQSLLDILF